MTYITLLSNSKSILPGGKVTDFRTRLEKPLFLDNDQWEIGVYRLYVPRCFDVLNEDDFKMAVSNIPKKVKKHKWELQPTTKTALRSDFQKSTYLKIGNNETLTATSDETVKYFTLVVNDVKLVEKQTSINIQNFMTTYLKENVDNKIVFIEHFADIPFSFDVFIPEKSYRSAKELVMLINFRLQKGMNKPDEIFFEMKDGFCVFRGMEEGRKLTMTDHLKGILGFDTETNFFNLSLIAQSQGNLYTGCQYGMLYSDIVEESLVGDKYFPLLAIIPLFSDKDASIATLEPTRILYKKVKTNLIDIIGVTLGTESLGILRYDHIQSVPLVVILHLRKING
jgi:hypothetical protein